MSAAIAIGAHALPPAPAPGPREGAGKAMETAAFASVIDALAPGQPHAASHADIGAIGDGGGASHPAGGKEKSPPRKAAHLELALANLPLVAPAAPQGGAMQVTATSAAQPLTKVAPGPVPLNPVVKAPAAAPAPRESLPAAGVAEAAVPAASPIAASASDLPLAQVLPLAQAGATASASVVPAPPVANTIDPQLNLHRAQARTFLAVDRPFPNSAAAPLLVASLPAEPAGSVGLAPIVDQSSPVAAAPAVLAQPVINSAAAASLTPARSTNDVRPNARAMQAPIAGVSAPQRRPLAAEAAPPKALAPSADGPPAARQSSGDPVHARAANQRSAAAPESPAVASTPPLNVQAANGAAANLAGALIPDQLPKFLAARLDELKPEIASRMGSSTNRAPEVVKELTVDLAPAGLGAVSVRMRLLDGKLAVEIDVSSAHALKAVEGERAALAASLGSNAQPLDALIIKQSDPPRSQSDNSDAPDSQREPRKDAQSQPDRGAPQERSFAQRPLASAPRRAGDLVI